MRILRIHAGGTPPALGAAVGEAVRAFNAALDIRLRFLSIGIEETVIDVTDAAGAAERVGAAISTSAPDLVLLLGGGPAAVAAASAAVRARVPVVRAGAGERAGDDADARRAADRLATVLLASDDAALAALRDEGLATDEAPVGADLDPETGERIVRAVSRARRRLTC